MAPIARAHVKWAFTRDNERMYPWWKGIPAHPDLGETIRTARMAKGLSLSELAAAVGCKDRRIVKYWQRGERCPSARMAGRLQAVLGVAIPMPAIKASELSRGSLGNIRRAQANALAALEAQAPAPVEPARMRIVNGWGRGF